MLELREVRKSYSTGDFTQVALDDVSIAFRENEFVAVLGPSGSGKTTMLNIVGGLDQYDSGDLVIDGVSTKQYRDRDWDTYRNERVGFVFQSYNLIPHQSVLANVELALTLAGVSRAERRRRAREALEAVGLGEHVHKRPNQLSGGQMQRVAIARALVNDPEILLADEPTGALDSVTSVQIMGLLTQIARDRLVVMVTHNPELAHEYATRIVRLTDGHVVEDTDPYVPASRELEEGRRNRRVGMGFLTAIGLSFNNLMTKKGRTLMTSFAGSIGIIGIAAILALANGVNGYIKDVERDTLSQYPLVIQQQSLDMGALLGTSSEALSQDEAGEDVIREVPMMKSMVASVGTNDLRSLKEFLDSPASGMDEHVSAIDYGYDVDPLIYSADLSDGPRRVNPDPAFEALGVQSSSMSAAMAPGMRTSAFEELMGDLDLVRGQYDVVAGAWPEDASELVVVLSSTGGLSDLALYSLGLLDPAELDDMLESLRNRESVEVETRGRAFDYDDVLGTELRLVQASQQFVYDEDFGVWTDRSDDIAHMAQLVRQAKPLKVVGVVQPSEGSSGALSPGIYWTRDLTLELMEEAQDAEIVRQQLADPETNVFTGRPFSDVTAGRDVDLSKLVTVDEEAIAKAFTFDEDALSSGFEGLDLQLDIDPRDFQIDPSTLPPLDLSALVGELDPTSMLPDATALAEAMAQAQPTLPEIDTEQLAAQVPGLVAAYTQFAGESGLDPTDVATALPAFLDTPAGLAAVAGAVGASGVDPVEAAELVQDYQRFVADQGLDESDVLTNLQRYVADVQARAVGEALTQVAASVDTSALQQRVGQQLQEALGQYMQQAMTSVMGDLATQLGSTLRTQLGEAFSSMGSGMAERLRGAMSVDQEAFAKAFSFEKSPEELSQLLMSVASTRPATYESNLTSLGYASEDEPSSVSIYPKDFEAKEQVTQILDDYNQRMRDQGHKDRVITYSDLVGALMTSVTDIINTISTVLIAFVAISLVVSSIMIGVITAISVLERTKEIGILRAVGASRRDIRRVFNAETLIVGAAAGLLGVVVTWLLTIPTNAIVLDRFDVPNVAVLPLGAAGILVLISMALTSVAGLLPASSASRKDPVQALRSE